MIKNKQQFLTAKGFLVDSQATTRTELLPAIGAQPSCLHLCTDGCQATVGSRTDYAVWCGSQHSFRNTDDCSQQ